MSGIYSIAVTMKWKVCGLKNPENIVSVLSLHPDWVGLIFYPGSPRYMADTLSPEELAGIPAMKKVGVFVNAAHHEILLQANRYDLGYVQLHGDESPGDCQALKREGLNVIKAFPVSQVGPDVERIKSYQEFIDFVLFDTKTHQSFGGTGQSFDRTLLKRYNLDIPFILSGGIDLKDIGELDLIEPRPVAIDVNSRFELSPGLKDIEKLIQLKHLIDNTIKSKI